jgi:RNA-directed DNA polymerase
VDVEAPEKSIFPLVSMGRLEALLGFSREYLWCVAKKAGTYYRSFDQKPKGSDKKWRHIDNPNEEIREIHKRIHKKILQKYPFPRTMLGGIKKCSVIENAQIHSGKKNVFAIDIRSCYPSTRHTQVFSAYREWMGCSTDIANILTKITTYQTRLPQGAPTSSLLANLVLLNVHNEIKKIVEEKGLTFTFYVDDIVISGDNVKSIIEPVIKALQQYGWSISCKKKKFMRRCDVQEVTGLVVNRKVNISKKYVEKLRKKIIEAAKKGFFTENEDRSFGGKITYIMAINERIGKRVQKLYDKIDLAIKGKTRTDKYEYRPCNCAKKHILKRTPTNTNRTD